MKPLYSRLCKALAVFVLIISLNTSVKATTLTLGDIAFTGFITNGTDGFSFVLLVPITAGTVINFTDNGWFGPAGVFGATETIITYTSIALPAGREIYITGLTAVQAGSGASAGVVTGTALNFSNVGDQCFAYQGTPPAHTFITGMHNNVVTIAVGGCADTDGTNWDGVCVTSGSNVSWKPAVLNGAGSTAFWVGTPGNPATEKDNWRFDNLLSMPLGTVAQVKAALANQAGWTLTDLVGTFTLPTNLTYLGLAPLPVSLASFTGKLNSDKTVTLQWKVAAQQDIQQYIVEESTDGITFRQSGTVAASNGTTENYSFIDMQVATGNNYYRVKTVELSGKISYSNIILINLKAGITVSLYPNPVTDKLTIQQFGSIQNKTAVLSDGRGYILQQIKLTSQQQTVNMQTYPSGVYILKMDDGTVFKVVKQ